MPADFASRRFVRLGMSFEAALVAVAWLLSWAFDLPWQGWLQVNAPQILWGLLATLPMVLGLGAMLSSGASWITRFREDTFPMLRGIFAAAKPWQILVISALAGVGEEWLFRGVLQFGLTNLTHWTIGLLVASLLFGAAHCLSRTYFWLATGVGLYLGLLAVVSESLIPPITAHACYDAVAIALICKNHSQERDGEL